MSLDQAMSRYGSHMGPIVVSPSPLWRPDAGSLWASNGVNRGEAGDVTSDLDSAAQGMVSYLNAQGCGPDATIGQFQAAYNAVYSPAIAIDNKYGPETAAALTRLIQDTTAQGVPVVPSAPPICVYGATSTPATSPLTGPLGSATNATGTRVAQAGMGNWGWAALAAGAALFLLANSKNPPKWVKRAGLHAGRRR